MYAIRLVRSTDTMGGRKRLRELHYIPLVDSDGAPTGRLQCKYCVYTGSDNITRLMEHVMKMHADEVDGLPNNTKITKWGERSFTVAEQNKAEVLLATLQVNCGLSFAALESEAFKEFTQALRYQTPMVMVDLVLLIRFDFKIPSRRTLQRRTTELYQGVMKKVQDVLSMTAYCSLAVDGWEDGHKLECLGVLARPMGTVRRASFLISFDQLFVRETADNVQSLLKVCEWVCISWLVRPSSTVCRRLLEGPGGHPCLLHS